MSDKIPAILRVVETKLGEISDLLSPEYRLTLFARHPNRDHADILMTIDDPETVIDAIRALLADPNGVEIQP